MAVLLASKPRLEPGMVVEVMKKFPKVQGCTSNTLRIIFIVTHISKKGVVFGLHVDSDSVDGEIPYIWGLFVIPTSEITRIWKWNHNFLVPTGNPPTEMAPWPDVDDLLVALAGENKGLIWSEKSIEDKKPTINEEEEEEPIDPAELEPAEAVTGSSEETVAAPTGRVAIP